MKLLLTTLIIFLTTIYACSIFAGVTNDIITEQILRTDKTIKELAKENGDFKNYLEAAKLKVKTHQVVIQNIKDEYIKKSRAKAAIKPPPKAIIFVSFSMPALSLKQIISDADRYHVPVVIRGLYKNSFRETIEKIFDLVKEGGKGGISINPVWFRKYNIKTVPALVVNNNSNTSNEKEKNNKKDSDENNDTQDFDVIYGNIHLKNALTIVVERGVAAKVAEAILSRSKT